MSLQKRIQNRKAGSTFFEGREQIHVAELMEKYPEGVTITSVILGTGNNGDYVAFTTQEEPNMFSFGGTVFFNIVKEIAQELGGIDVFNDELKSEPSKVKFIRKVNKNNKPYYDVE